ncbi:hypothetical protein M9Y10_009095 [Tritrichomonas musculus]|uniref:Protein kinase domain-containing protein n=1 Tax=Tritrichomonas musculus TaxID=1915356 RepID=A0ABR2IZW1_9EUKA
MQQQFWIPHNVGNYAFINEVEENKWNAMDQTSKKEVFVQIVSKKDYQNKDSFYKLTRYVELTKNIQSKYFSKCQDFFEDKRFYYVVLEKPDGITLKEYVEQNCGKITEEYVKNFFVNLIAAFESLDYNQFSITYNNIYVNNNDLHDNTHKFELTIIPYMMKYSINPTYVFEAPEVLLGKAKNSVSNVWTCGILLYYITIGSLPFSVTPFNASEFQKIMLNEKIQIPAYVPADIQDLLTRMLTKNTFTRMKFEQLFNHYWVKKDSMKPTEKSYQHINKEQFPNLWAQSSSLINKSLSEDFMKQHHLQIQIIASKKRPSLINAENIKDINIL